MGMFNRFATGLVTGGIIAAVGISYMMTEPKTRKRVVKESKRAMRRAGDYISDMF
jgi:hypothetical protein